MSVRDDIAAVIVRASRDYYAVDDAARLNEEGGAVACADAVLLVPAVARAIKIAEAVDACRIVGIRVYPDPADSYANVPGAWLIHRLQSIRGVR